VYLQVVDMLLYKGEEELSNLETMSKQRHHILSRKSPTTLRMVNRVVLVLPFQKPGASHLPLAVVGFQMLIIHIITLSEVFKIGTHRRNHLNVYVLYHCAVDAPLLISATVLQNTLLGQICRYNQLNSGSGKRKGRRLSFRSFTSPTRNNARHL
jgi:hypothetical protein